MKKIYFIGLVSVLSFYSCSSVFNGVVLPNQCKKCELINNQNGKVLFTNEGCGSANTKLEEEAKLKAYELSRGSYNLCDLEVRCETWREKPKKE